MSNVVLQIGKLASPLLQNTQNFPFPVLLEIQMEMATFSCNHFDPRMHRTSSQDPRSPIRSWSRRARSRPQQSSSRSLTSPGSGRSMWPLSHCFYTMPFIAICFFIPIRGAPSRNFSIALLKNLKIGSLALPLPIQNFTLIMNMTVFFAFGAFYLRRSHAGQWAMFVISSSSLRKVIFWLIKIPWNLVI